LLGFLSPPSAHSPNADELNTLYWVMLVVGIVLVIGVNGALLAMVMRFRAARGREPRSSPPPASSGSWRSSPSSSV
jgi:heme/copper-type cytochrome/quinol oxidase subunit 2